LKYFKENVFPALKHQPMTPGGQKFKIVTAMVVYDGYSSTWVLNMSSLK
jgi:hypothetical protein